jgi:hypothetical protein
MFSHNRDEVIRLDGDEAKVREVLRVSEGSDEDDEKWAVMELEETEDGTVYMVEEYMGHLTLYERVADPPPDIHYHEDNMVDIRNWRDEPHTRSLRYAEGRDTDGGEVLRIGDLYHLEDDDVRPYGPQNRWLARAETPARQLARHQVHEGYGPSLAVTALNFVLALVLPLWGLFHLYITPVAFPTWFVIFGIVAMILACVGPAFFLFRAAQFGGGTFALWLVTVILDEWQLFGDVSVGSAFSLTVGREVVILLLPWLLFMVWRRLFHIIMDAAVYAALSSVVLYTIGLGIVVFFDEDLGWLADWWYYFRQSPWGYLWLVVFLIWLGHKARDYWRVPFSRKGFFELRERIVGRLTGGQALEKAGVIGRRLDDLADALRLSESPDVLRMSFYEAGLEQAARVFKKLGAMKDLAAKTAPLADQVRDDLTILAGDLETMAPGGDALRLSPCLRNLADV